MIERSTLIRTVVVIDLNGRSIRSQYAVANATTYVDQVAQLEGTCQTGSLSCDTLHEAAVAGEDYRIGLRRGNQRNA